MTRPRGRPKSDVETGVIAVRLPKAMIAHLDRYIDRLASQTGVKPTRNTVMRHVLARVLTVDLAPAPAEVVPPGSDRDPAIDHQRQALRQRTQDVYKRSQALRTRSQTLSYGIQRLSTHARALCTYSRQLRGAARAVRARRHTDSRHGPTAGDAYDGTALSDDFIGR